MDKLEFISKIGKLARQQAPLFGIKVISPIIAQACNESDFGNDILAKEYHNYFGIKTGSRWRGPAVNLRTKEVYDNETVSVRDNFRVYDNMEAGVVGYFAIVLLPRYANLKGVTDPETYLKNITDDGYCTDPDYVEKCMKIIKQYDLTVWDSQVPSAGVTAEDVINVLHSWIGKNEADGSHHEIVDIYNTLRPLPRGYKLTYDDKWCCATITAAGIVAHASDLVGRECSCEQMIGIYKSMGIWIEDGTITPKPGDIILYNWQDNTQPNDGYAKHIGMVEYVRDGIIIAIEGNYHNAVGRRPIEVGDGRIRGFARPHYTINACLEGFRRAADGIRWWYQLADGSYAKDGWYWLTEATCGTSGWYLFDDEGYMLTGHQERNGDSFYLCAKAGRDEGKCMITDSRGVLHVPATYDFKHGKYIV